MCVCVFTIESVKSCACFACRYDEELAMAEARERARAGQPSGAKLRDRKKQNASWK